MIESQAQKISLQKCRYVLKVFELGSISRAAETLGRSQTAITKAINDVEKLVGVRLFERSHAGASPTVYGEVFARRTEFARDELLRSGQVYLRHIDKEVEIDRIPIFNMTISNHRMIAFVQTCDLESISAAASAIGVSVPAVKKTITEIERHLGLSLFEHSPLGIVRPTPLAHEIARSMKVAFGELSIAMDEVHSIDGLVRGRVRIGTVPSARSVINARTIARFFKKYPSIKISTFDSHFERTELALRSGEIDFVIGPLHLPDVGDIRAEPFMMLPAVVVVGKGHPITRKKRVGIDDIGDMNWVLPPTYVPLRKGFNEFIDEVGAVRPGKFVETSSNSTMCSLLFESDFAAIAPVQEFYYELQSGKLEIVRFEPAIEAKLKKLIWQSYIFVRRQSALSPAAQMFVSELRETSAAVELEFSQS